MYRLGNKSHNYRVVEPDFGTFKKAQVLNLSPEFAFFRDHFKSDDVLLDRSGCFSGAYFLSHLKLNDRQANHINLPILH